MGNSSVFCVFMHKWTKTKKKTLNMIKNKNTAFKSCLKPGFFVWLLKEMFWFWSSLLLSQFLDFLQCVVQDHIVALKFKVPKEFLLLQQQWVPQDVIWPHLAVGNLVRIEPLRPHFWRREKTIILQYRKGKNRSWVKQL